jgi:large subunit ribosomal protein L15
MPMYRRLPKRGFHKPEKVTAQPVNLKDLTRVSVSEINPDTLTTAGLITRPTMKVKILGTGDVARAYTVRGVAVSASAKAKIEAAGGSVEA